MGDLSKDFSRSEFQCKCGCGFDTVDAELLKVVQDVRDHYHARTTINSACRCLEHNRSVGSTDTSQHPKAKAADITVRGVSPARVHHYLVQKYPDKYGIGNYADFTHVDVRSDRARW